jgi:hypothetical protein
MMFFYFTTFLILPLLGVIFAYIAICFLINKTKYSFERGSLEIRKGPLPWFPKKFVLPSSEIEQFYFQENDSSSNKFLLMVRLSNSSNICIDKGIIYAPDFLINAGGVINCYTEVIGVGRDMAVGLTENIYGKTLDIFRTANEQQITTQKAAMLLAQQRIDAVAKLKAVM